MPNGTSIANSNAAALIGFLFTLPFVTINAIVSLRMEPFYSFLGSFPAIRNSPIFPLLLLLLFPIGAFVAIRPMVQKGVGGKETIHVANITTAAIIMIIFLILFTALGEELYRCDVLKIPNCD